MRALGVGRGRVSAPSLRVSERLGRDAVLAERFVFRGVPDCIRSDNGPEFTVRAARESLAQVSAETLFVEPFSNA